jgi:enoyl-CoA hydratase/carnithine racemase
VRSLTAALLAWRDDPQVLAVAIRGMGKDANQPTGNAPFGAFCAGGDLRFFHQTISAGGPELEDFFTEEYQLNHLIHTYPKPYIAFMDGIVMGGGMGISQGASLRIVTERTKMAMPETRVGLFPDVGGGYFLSRCAGRLGEYLGLSGRMLSGADAVGVGLADRMAQTERLPALWAALGEKAFASGADVQQWLLGQLSPLQTMATQDWPLAEIDAVFGLPSVGEIIQALEANTSDWAQASAKLLRQLSPLMLAVSLAQIRRARSMSLADELRMERDMVRHCFNPVHLGRSGLESETIEGIRALAVDKDHHPQWSPARIEDVMPEMVEAFFVSPWPEQAHPLRDLG